MTVTAARLAFISQSLRYATNSDSAIKTNYPLAREVSIDSFFSASADAIAVNSDAFDLLKVARGAWELIIPEVLDLDFSQKTPTITFFHSKYGLSAGKTFMVTEYGPDRANQQTRLVIWG